MAYQIGWIIPQRIMHVRYYDTFTNEDANAAVREGTVLLDGSQDHTFHVIVNYSANPELGFSFREALKSEELKRQFTHPRLGWSVRVVSDNWHYHYLFTTFLQERADARIHLCATLTEAMTFLRQQDPSLPNE